MNNDISSHHPDFTFPDHYTLLRFTLFSMLLSICFSAEAQPTDDVDVAIDVAIDVDRLNTCLLEQLQNATADVTVGSLRELCSPGPGQIAVQQTETEDNLLEQPVRPPSLVIQRLQRESFAEANNLGLIPHLRNYVLPATYSSSPNEEPYKTAFGDILPDEQLDNIESKFQLSIKFGLADNLLMANDQLQFGFTTSAYWQAFNNDLSSPFRETNYKPEIFYVAPLEWRPFNVDSTLVSLGVSHQSNGRGGLLSRSWNRVNSSFVWEKGNFVFGLEAWWRIPEDEKVSPLSAAGDDNPDIEDFLGNFEFTTIYNRGGHEIAAMVRNNLRSDNKGFLQLDWTFPLWRGVRGYAQYINGYGESLIDYDAHIERFGIGILLTDLL